LLLGALTDVGCAERVHRPTIAVAVSDKRADADNGMVDVLRKLVADGLAHFCLGLVSHDDARNCRDFDQPQEPSQERVRCPVRACQRFLVGDLAALLGAD